MQERNKKQEMQYDRPIRSAYKKRFLNKTLELRKSTNDMLRQFMSQIKVNVNGFTQKIIIMFNEPQLKMRHVYTTMPK